jgi:hypothetical protein
VKTMTRMEKGARSVVDQGGDPRRGNTIPNPFNKFLNKSKPLEGIEKKGIPNTVEGISHVDLDGHPNIFPSFAA